MYDNQNHIIQYEIFDIGFPRRSGAVDLQNRVSRLAGGRLDRVMGEVFDRLAGPGVWLKIDSLQLDIGVIPYANFEEHLLERCAEALERELLTLLAEMGYSGLPDSGPGLGDRGVRANGDAHVGTADGIIIDRMRGPVKARYLDLLEYFLLQGTLPWWANSDIPGDPAAVINILIGEAAVALRSMLLRIGRSQAVRRRLVYQFPAETIQGVVSILEPEEAAFILEYHTSLTRVQQVRKLVQAEQSVFGQAAWLFILTVLLADKGSHFSRKQFVRDTLTGMANYFNLRYEQLLGLLSAALPSDDPIFNRVNTLPAILRELELEQVGRLPETEPDKMKLFRYYLLHGSLPWSSASIDQRELSGIFSRLLSREPAPVIHMLRQLSFQPLVSARLAVGLDEAVTGELIRLLEPAGAPAIIYYLKSVEVLHRQTQMVRSGQKDFALGIRQIALQFLLSERGSVYNTKVFLESNIRGMARANHLNYSELLAFLVRGWEEEAIPDEGQRVSFLYLLRVLQEEQAEEAGEQAETGIREMGRTAAEADKVHDVEDDALREADASRDAEERQLRDARSRDILRYWLYYGQLPWWGNDTGASPAAIWASLQTRAPRHIASLLSFAGNDIGRRERLIMHISPTLLLAAFRLMPGGIFAVEYYAAMLQLTGNSGPIRTGSDESGKVQWLQTFWEEFRNGSTTKFDPERFVSRIIDLLAAHTGVFASIIARALLGAAKRDSKYTYPIGLIGVLRGIMTKATEQERSHQATNEKERKKRAEEEGERQEREIRESEIRKKQIKEKSMQEEELHAREQRAKEMREREKPEREIQEREMHEREMHEREAHKKETDEHGTQKRFEGTIYIRNAGLVLLHPFLATYFKRVELLGPEGFVSGEAQFRAIHLLQFVADGTEEHPEQELALNKILCGLPVNEPVPLRIYITEKEKEVSEELLHAVRGQWEKIKNTSIEGLRNAFLQRQGALSETDDGWTLRVEQRGYDVLLQTLPWSIGMIKTSWMKKIIQTEWS